MFYDKDNNFRKDRMFWLNVIVGMGALCYAKNRYYLETDRARMTERLSGFPSYADKPHHFINRGGVLIMKEFIGFEKYHSNGEEMMNWYKMAYPKQCGDKK